jgi:polyisoprenoid-binding protein YceI
MKSPTIKNFITARRTAFTAAALVAGVAAFTLAPFPPATAIAQNEGENLPDGAFAIDPVHSSVLFRVVYMDSSHFFGRFDQMSGSFIVDPDNTDDSFINITIPTDSVNSGNTGRDNHLKGEDFFHARRHPEATFVTTSAQRVDDDTVRFTGDFSLRGVTNEVTVDVDVVGQTTDPRANKPRRGWIARWNFDRLDYGVNYSPELLSNDTELIVSITGLQR